MAPSKYMVWNDAVHSDILAIFADVMKPSSEQWQEIMDRVQSLDYNCTLHALRYQLPAICVFLPAPIPRHQGLPMPRSDVLEHPITHFPNSAPSLDKFHISRQSEILFIPVHIPTQGVDILLLPTHTTTSTIISIHPTTRPKQYILHNISYQLQPFHHLVPIHSSLVTMAARTIWDDKVRSDLLQAVLAEITPSSQDWDRIITRMNHQGYNFTSSAAL